MNKKTELIEIYKSQVHLICSISDRQTLTNRHYILVISALILALYTLSTNMDKLAGITTIIPITIDVLIVISSISGILVSVTWFLSTNYYTYLVSCKHDSLKELERKLEHQFFNNEWDHLKENKKPQIYLNLSMHKLFVPFTSWGAFSILLFLGCYQSEKILWWWLGLPAIGLIIMGHALYFTLRVRSKR